MMRNLLTILPDGVLWLGDGRVGFPAEDIPSDSLLYDIAQYHAGHQLRLYIRSAPDNIYFNEDGTYEVI